MAGMKSWVRKTGHRYAEDPADEQGQEGTIQGAPNLGQDTEFGLVGVPGLGSQEFQAVRPIAGRASLPISNRI